MRHGVHDAREYGSSFGRIFVAWLAVATAGFLIELAVRGPLFLGAIRVVDERDVSFRRKSARAGDRSREESHWNRLRSIRPPTLTLMASARNRRRCSSKPLRRGRAMAPRLLMIRCHGSRSFPEEECRTRAT